MYIEGIFSNHFVIIWIPKLAGWRVWVEVPTKVVVAGA